MDRYRLSDKEREVYDKVEALFLTLPSASQYNVLKKVAHNMDRDVVRYGQVRVAAAAARGAALAQSGSKRNSDNIEGKSKTAKKEDADPIYVKWAATEEGKQLIANHESLKKRLQAMPKPRDDDEKAVQAYQEAKTAVSGASALKRQTYQSFRTKQVGPSETEKATGDAPAMPGPPKPTES